MEYEFFSKLFHEQGATVTVSVATVWMLWTLLGNARKAYTVDKQQHIKDQQLLNDRIDRQIATFQEALNHQAQICSDELSAVREQHSKELSEIRKHGADLNLRYQSQISAMNKSFYDFMNAMRNQLAEMNDKHVEALRDLSEAIKDMKDDSRG